MVQSPLEFPQQLREFTEKNVEQASAAYGQFMEAVAQAMGTSLKALPSNEFTSGFEAVQKKAVKFAKKTPMPASSWRTILPMPKTSRV